MAEELSYRDFLRRTMDPAFTPSAPTYRRSTRHCRLETCVCHDSAMDERRSYQFCTHCGCNWPERVVPKEPPAEMNALDHLRAVLTSLEETLGWELDLDRMPPIVAARAYLATLETEARSDWERDQAKKDRS